MHITSHNNTGFMIHISYNGLIHNPTKMSRANVESLGDIRPEQPKVALFVLQKQGCHVILPPSYTVQTLPMPSFPGQEMYLGI